MNNKEGKERLPNSAGGLQSSTKSLQIESESNSPSLARKNINTFYNVNSEKVLQQEDTRYWAHRLNSINTDVRERISKTERNSVTSQRSLSSLVGADSLERAHSISIAERMIEKTGTAVTSEAAAKYSAVTQGNNQDSEIGQELKSIFITLEKCIQLREEYLSLSCQTPGSNPKDLDEWGVYPYPPQPSYPENAGKESVYSLTEEFDLSMCRIDERHEFTYKMEDGVFSIYKDERDSHSSKNALVHFPSIKKYYTDMDYILSICAEGPTKSFAFRRLRYLESKFNMYILLNEYQEMADSKRVPHRDFYNVRKVDTHIHHSSCMNQKHLLRFIKHKLKKNPNDLVIYRDEHYLTLAQVFESLKLTAYDLSIDTLDMHAHKDSFHRFDKFNLKYNPIGESRLREIFLKTDNLIKGKYLAELTKEVISDLQASKYQMVEYRLSIYGRNKNEWDQLASWVVDNSIFSHNVRWLIQVPRLYNVYKASGVVTCFEEMLSNIFTPLFEVTQDPKTHPKLHVFLQRVVGFDSVDDESKIDRRSYKHYPPPKQWTNAYNPPYSYYLYYMYANLCNLNYWRKERGFNTFVLRPHAGEAGDTDHLTSAFLTSHSISHGILLRKVPVLQYLYYLEQIGIAMSPLSNNALFLSYERNPFLSFFQRGLNISLSTDDPLQFHFTKEPLIEEYSVAAQIWKLSSTDMCEIARNSVLQSGFEMQMKKRWLGENCERPGPAGNDIQKTNVPTLRLSYRYTTLMEERFMVLGSLRASPLEEEDSHVYPDLMEVPSIIPEDVDSEYQSVSHNHPVTTTSVFLDEELEKLNLSRDAPSLTSKDTSKDTDQEMLNSSINSSFNSSSINHKRTKSNSIYRSVPAEPLLQGTRLEFSPRRSAVISDSDVNAPILELSAPIMPVIDSQMGFVAAGLVRSKSKLISSASKEGAHGDVREVVDVVEEEKNV